MSDNRADDDLTSPHDALSPDLLDVVYFAPPTAPLVEGADEGTIIYRPRTLLEAKTTTPTVSGGEQSFTPSEFLVTSEQDIFRTDMAAMLSASGNAAGSQSTTSGSEANTPAFSGFDAMFTQDPNWENLRGGFATEGYASSDQRLYDPPGSLSALRGTPEVALSQLDACYAEADSR